MTFLSSINVPFIALALVILIFWVMAFIIIYHLIRFGVGRAPKIVALVFFIGSLVIMLVIFSRYLVLYHV